MQLCSTWRIRVNLNLSFNWKDRLHGYFVKQKIIFNAAAAAGEAIKAHRCWCWPAALGPATVTTPLS